jgi:hypothetical protein
MGNVVGTILWNTCLNDDMIMHRLRVLAHKYKYVEIPISSTGGVYNNKSSFEVEIAGFSLGWLGITDAKKIIQSYLNEAKTLIDSDGIEFGIEYLPL